MADRCNATNPPPSVASDDVLKVWGMINRHFESALVSAGRSDAVTRAKTEIKSQVADLRDVVENCVKRLNAIEDYIHELQRLEGRDAQDQLTSASRCDALTGDWHFLYLSTGNVFGYLKMMPESVTAHEDPDPDTGSRRAAAFTVPLDVLDEAGAVDGEPHVRADGGCASLCPCCQVSFDSTVFWKHALFEIASRGNSVTAWQVVDRDDNKPRWVVDRASGWRDPIYRPRDARGMCEIGQSLGELNLPHFLSDRDFSSALDATFQYLEKELTS